MHAQQPTATATATQPRMAGKKGGPNFSLLPSFSSPLLIRQGGGGRAGKKDRQSYFLLFLFLFLFPPLFSFSLPPSFFSGGEKTVGGNTKRENFHVKKARPGSVLFLFPPLFPSQVRRFLSPILSYEYIVQGTMWLALLFRPVSLFPAESRAASFSPRPSSRADFRIGRAKTQIKRGTGKQK